MAKFKTLTRFVHLKFSKFSLPPAIVQQFLHLSVLSQMAYVSHTLGLSQAVCSWSCKKALLHGIKRGLLVLAILGAIVAVLVTK